MKNLIVGIVFLFLAACSSDEPANKIYFHGTVEKTLNIDGEDKIQSVTVKLDSGKIVSVFVEQSNAINSGEKVRVFKYEDSSVHYLEK